MKPLRHKALHAKTANPRQQGLKRGSTHPYRQNALAKTANPRQQGLKLLSGLNSRLIAGVAKTANPRQQGLKHGHLRLKAARQLAKTANPRQQGLKRDFRHHACRSSCLPKRLIQDNKD